MVRKTIFCLLLICWSFSSSLAQEVPARLDFCGIQLSFSSKAQRILQDHIQKMINSPRYFNQMVKRAHLYMPFIEEALAHAQAPADLKFLAIQESALRPDVVSSSNAVGFWQFKAPTAKEFGLMVDDRLDERKHIFKASYAAGQYIARANKDFDNWLYAIIAYYEGLSGAVPHTDPKYYGTDQMYIDENFHWYALKAIAHKIAYGEAVEMKKRPEICLVPYSNEGETNLKRIIEAHNLASEEFFRYNKWISNPKKLPKGKNLTYYVPRDGQFYTGHKEDPNKKSLSGPPLSSPSLASSNSSSPTVGELSELNGSEEPKEEVPLRPSPQVQPEPQKEVVVNRPKPTPPPQEREPIPNTTLPSPEPVVGKTESPPTTLPKTTIPKPQPAKPTPTYTEPEIPESVGQAQNQPSPRPQPQPQNTPASMPMDIGTVALGREKLEGKAFVDFDLLYDFHYGNQYILYTGEKVVAQLSEKFGIPLIDLLSWNDLIPGTEPQAGRLLYLDRPNRLLFHVVQSGESLESIAARYLTSVDRIKNRNRLDAREDIVYVGQKLYLKERRPKNEQMIVLRFPDFGPPTPSPTSTQPSIPAPVKEAAQMVGAPSITSEASPEKTNVDPPVNYPRVDEATGRWIMHAVQPGEDIQDVARRYKIPIGQIKEANGLEDNVIVEGQVLRLLIRKK
ncbi:MAG: LysM peptidoglycan-binding domain-containing protein [Bacteroidota bacterium]